MVRVVLGLIVGMALATGLVELVGGRDQVVLAPAGGREQAAAVDFNPGSVVKLHAGAAVAYVPLEQWWSEQNGVTRVGRAALDISMCPAARIQASSFSCM
jgi:hypothetical protein